MLYFLVIQPIKRKVNHIITALILAGFVILILGAIIVWSDFMVRLVMGTFIVTVAYAFFYGAYKIWSIKKDVDKLLKF